MASCPTCNKDIDPLRAPSARIVGGRVLTYCSAECAAAATDAGAAAAKARLAEAAAPAPEASPAQRALDAIKTSGRVAKATMPVSSAEILEEEDVPAPRVREARARTEPPAPPPARPRRRGLVLMFAIAIIIGGMAIAIVQAVSPSSPSPAKAGAVADARAAVALPPPPDPVPTAAAAAQAALAALVASESPRVRRVAATALARTGDAAAIAALGELVATEPSEITRLDIAYALARAGDARGAEALAAGLKSSRRDVRADAARLLILIGDPDGAGAKELGRFLDNRSQRLGAAEALARIANAEAVGVLDEIHLDEAAAADDRIRAAIALGRARRGDVAPELHTLLGDGRFNAFAALALAELRDPAGREVLVKQLAVSSLRVGAALALRRLDDKLDVAPLLPPLTAALAGDQDVARDAGALGARVSAAEAILILTGPRSWADRD